MKKLAAIALALFLIIAVPLSANADSDGFGSGLSSLFDAHGAVMLLIDPQTGEILYANEAAAGFYGYSKLQLESMDISQINTLTPDDTALEMQAALEENRNYFVFKHRLATGELRTVEV